MSFRLHFALLFVLLVLNISCSSNSGVVETDLTGTDQQQQDSSADVVGRQDLLPMDLGADTTVPPDVDPDTAVDLVDMVPDSVPPDVTDVVPDNTDTVQCEPVTCALYCPLGFAKDADGCPVCSCVACELDSQCQALLPDCPTPVCAGDFDCACDCTTTPATTLECKNGESVPLCNCTPFGFACVQDAHLQCAESCKPGDNWLMPCGDLVVDEQLCTCEIPACSVECNTNNTPAWLDTCTGALVLEAACAGCKAYCGHPGTAEEGWYNGCNHELIVLQKCAPAVDCVFGGVGCKDTACPLGQETIFTCPDSSEVQMCACKPLCMPTCQNMGSALEGLYDPCTGQQLVPGKCSNCVVTCDYIGSKSEGWYSSCTGLIGWDNCSQGTWECNPDVFDLCTKNTPCTEQSHFLTNEVSDFGICCAGLTLVADGAFPKDVQCGPAGDSGTGWCIYCGDGVCDEHEAYCNCPMDCPEEPSDCDPIAQTGCGAEQCHLVDWVPMCGPEGSAGLGSKCDGETHCGPGLACGVGDNCFPACTDDQQCIDHPDFYEFCLKKNGNSYGHCFVYL